MKYNAVLRAKSGNSFLTQQCRLLCKGNDYPYAFDRPKHCLRWMCFSCSVPCDSAFLLLAVLLSLSAFASHASYSIPSYSIAASRSMVAHSLDRVGLVRSRMRAHHSSSRHRTSIHATNSCVLKLSKLTKAGKVWRGIKDAKLPKEFWVANEMGVRGGIEYGFSSTTTDKAQALAYASGGGMGKVGDAMTIFEMQMGMVDRGADRARQGRESLSSEQ